MEQKQLTATEAAERLGISRSTMTHWLRQGRVKGATLEPGVTENGDRWLIPTPVEISEPDTVTVGEAARYLDRSRNWVWGLVKRGIIKAEQPDEGRRWRVSRRSMEAYKRKQDALDVRRQQKEGVRV